MYWKFLLFSFAFASISISIEKPPQNKTELKEHMKKALLSISSLTETSSVSSTMYNLGNYWYFTALYIGTPPKMGWLAIDTRSPWITIPDIMCRECYDRFYFDKSKSTTYETNNIAYEVKYEIGYVSGIISFDSVYIGDNATIEVKNQTFLLYDYERYLPDGILGLSLGGNGYDTFIANLKNQEKIQNASFALYLNDNKFCLGDAEPSSNLMIGGYDLETYSTEDEFVYVKLIGDRGHWEIPCDSIWLDKYQIMTRTRSAIVGTGIFFIIGPYAEVTNIINYLIRFYGCYYSIDGTLLCKCATARKYPEIRFVLGGKSITIGSDVYFINFERNGYCDLIIKGMAVDFWQLGDVFMRKYYVNFDMDNKQIGFAKSIKSDRWDCHEFDEYLSEGLIKESSFLAMKILIIVTITIIFWEVYTRYRKKNVSKNSQELSLKLLA